MVTAIQTAQVIARKAIESTYDSFCTIIESGSEKDEVTKITRDEERITATEEPCRLSFVKISNAVQTDMGAMVTQIVKLFIAPEIKISSNSEIIVTTKEKTITSYRASSKPAIYNTHQEIILNLSKEWA